MVGRCWFEDRMVALLVGKELDGSIVTLLV